VKEKKEEKKLGLVRRNFENGIKWKSKRWRG
jgi:hypothetical protein